MLFPSVHFRFSWWKSLVFLLFVHVALCCLAAWQAFTGDFDTGTVELMAVNIARGEDFPLFWYGLHYAGALEAYLAAFFIRIFGFSELALCLSPIFFSTLWILATYLLFAEIFDHRAGLTAAVAAVFPGYFLHYYCYSLSGGYSVILGLGTMIFWLGMRVYTRAPTGYSLCGHILAIGCLAALSLWVHFFVFPYLLITALLLLFHWRRRNYGLRVILCYCAGACVSFMGLIPFFLVTQAGEGSGSVTGFLFSRHHFLKSFHTLWTYDLLKMVAWKASGYWKDAFTWFFPGYLLLVVFLSAVMILVLYRRSRDANRAAIFSPLLFVLFFLLFFLFHRMAVIPSPRYVLGIWAMYSGMIWACFSVWSREKRAVLPIILFFWIGYNGLGNFVFIQNLAPVSQQHRINTRESVALADRHGLTSVILLGDDYYGFGGQKLSAFAGNAIHFVSSDKERYQKNAQDAEGDPDYGLMCASRSGARVRDALALLGVSYREEQQGGNTLFFDFSSPLFHEKSLLTGFKVHIAGHTSGESRNLFDRNISTEVAWQGNSEGTIEFIFAEEQLLSRITLFGMPSREEGLVRGLPVSYRLESAGEGETSFSSLYRVHNKVNQSYVQGGHVYVSGYFGKTECRFTPRRVKKLRIILAPGHAVHLGEIGIFAASDFVSDSLNDEVEKIISELQAKKIAFTITDRWLSSQLIARHKKTERLPALPRFNPRFAVQNYSRVLVPASGTALVVDKSVAGDCQQQIVGMYGAGVIGRRVDLNTYSLFFFNDYRSKKEQGLLYWNGHLLVRMTDYNQMATLNLSGTGIGAIDPVHEKSRGFYHDGWTNGHGRLYNLDRVPGKERLLVLVTGGHAPLQGDPDKLRLSLTVNGRVVPLLGRDKTCYFFRLPATLDTIEEVGLSSITFRPANGDWRVLGIDVRRFLIF